ncbi:MAG: hypothetical protein NW224_30510 [Leptolyngbyaceae cyanobacterium bins.302]|nr:hypothetical protein [Leptolyngbyaceae cyanobacterium bins.302]
MVTLKLQQHTRKSQKIPFQKIWDKVLSYGARNLYGLFHNPGLFVVRKLARIELFREGLFWASQITKTPPKVDSKTSLIASDSTVEAIVASIEQQGYFAGLQLHPCVVQQILDYAQTGICSGDRTLKFPYDQKEQVETKQGKKFLCCSYPVEDSPIIMQLVQDKTILAIASQYLKAKPVYVSGELLWSYPIEASQSEKLSMAQVFHYDLDDVRSIKLFFYLNDVDAFNGAHVCIQNSHRGKPIMHQLLGQRCASIPDERIVSCYGAENVVTFCGKAGFGFVEDPCCFHKGAAPIAGERLLLQLQFSVHDHGNVRACNI